MSLHPLILAFHTGKIVMRCGARNVDGRNANNNSSNNNNSNSKLAKETSQRELKPNRLAKKQAWAWSPLMRK